uniref:Uncharacterized protein n=1 Tax=Gadus morhua TaxID=8049 RepID=A0A8C5ADJ5_GADMO
MQSGVKTFSAGGGAASLCCLLVLLVIYSHLLREGQLAVGTCEVVLLNRDSSVPLRTVARQTARCACRRGQIAGTTRARPACVDGQWSPRSRPPHPPPPAGCPRARGRVLGRGVTIQLHRCNAQTSTCIIRVRSPVKHKQHQRISANIVSLSDDSI